jgi:signal transduction histidine kinase
MTPHVSVELPVRLSPSVNGGAGFSEAAGDWRDLTIRRSGPSRNQILLVEDDRGVRDALQEILEEKGYAVTPAENGRRALQTLRTIAPPDLIVLDLRMPIMDGWEFRAEQKNDATLACIPVLAVSADGSAKAAAIDAEAYLRKPLNTDELLRTVVRILGEADRRQILRRLEEAERFAAQGRLAASVGHEINNPLTYVSLNIEQAVTAAERVVGPDVDAGVLREVAVLPELLRECKVGLDRIRDVARELLGLSRSSAVRPEIFSLNGLVEESLAMARSHVENRVYVRKRYGEIAPVSGKRSALGQVFLNLIVNAAQALPEGTPTNELRLETHEHEGHAVVEVADTGVGIPSHIIPHIFDPFYTTKPIGKGTGLGLAVSYGIVADHGGRIDVESEVGRGSVFRVSLPIARRLASPLVSVRETHPNRARAHARILVIDDETIFGRTLSRALREHDLTVVERAEEAFTQLAADDVFDVILCDLQMPKIGGPGVLDRIKHEWPHLADRMIFMTGGAFTPESREFIDHATHIILTKPFPLEELRAAIDDVISVNVVQ